MSGERGTILCLVGPTAVGKTALVAALAEAAPIEVISLDSRQIYHGLRIGTAQPTARERARCPHHLVDFVPCDRRYDAAAYRRDFEAAHRDICARGRIPVLAGGAGLYLRALQEGLLDLPGADPAALAGIRTELESLPPGEVRARLAEADPASCARIHPNDLYRSRRALEIYMLTGRTMTRQAAAQTAQPSLGLEFRIFKLERSVPELDARIALRTADMLARGWVQEARAALLQHGPAAPGLGSLGYREIVRHLEGRLPEAELAGAIVRVTRQYAKRQRTWFRKTPAAGSGHPDDRELHQTLIQAIRKTTP